MIKLRDVLLSATIASAALTGTAFAQVTDPSTGVTTTTVPIPGTDSSTANESKDPLVKKRVADAAAKKQYKMRKKAANAEQKAQKADAKADLKAEKKQSTMERKEEIGNSPLNPGPNGGS